jgi:plastocyanin
VKGGRDRGKRRVRQQPAGTGFDNYVKGIDMQLEEDPVPSSLATYVASRRFGRRKILRLLTAAGAAVVAAPALRRVAAQEATPTAVPTPALGLQPDGSRVWRVQVGASDEATLTEAMAFLPGTITVNAGDSVFFDFGNPPRFHTVSFMAGQAVPDLVIPDTSGTPVAGRPKMILNPVVAFPVGGTAYDGSVPVSSGVPLDPTAAPYVVSFPKEGTFDYVCMVHDEVMKGKVIVQAKGATPPHEQTDYDKVAADEWAKIIADGTAAAAKYEQATSTKRSDGTMLWDVAAGAGQSQAEVMRFVPDSLTVNVGDTVRWTYHALVDPHTVTFSSGEAPPDLFLVEPQAGGPPHLVINPLALWPAGGSTYSGTGYANSGFMGKAFQGPTTYELTFDKAGDYDYYCIIHGSPTQGMHAKITVS